MALGFGGYVLLFSNIAELGWIYSGSILRNLPEIFSKRDRYGVLALYRPPNRVSPGALGLGALTYNNCGHKQRNLNFRVFFDFNRLCTGGLDIARELRIEVTTQ